MTCPSANQPADNDAIEINEVIVNGTTISPEDIAREVQYHPASSPEEGVQKASEALIIQTVLLQKAKLLGLDQGRDDSGFPLGEETIITRLLEQEAAAPQASEEDCQRYFDANNKKFYSSPLLEVRHILIAADPKDSQQRDQAKESATALVNTLQESPEQFSALAKQHSDCPSKETDGSLGQLSKGQTTPEFEQQVFPLSEGLAKHPIETRYGFHVVFVDRKIDGQPLAYEHVKEKIAEYLNEASQRKTISQYIRILLGEADISGIELDIDSSPLLQ